VPKYCDNSNLIDNCEVCGCDDGLSFSRDTCETTSSCSHLAVAGNEPIADAGGTITVDFGTPGAILDGSNSFDINGLDLTYKWEYEGTVISELTNNPKALFKYPSEGTFTVTLTVTSLGLSDQDTATIIVLPKQGCSETSARYFPPDTVCNKKWPSKQGNIILGNTLERSCDIIEVCDENLDYMIDEAITCCGSSDGVSKLSSEQEKLACEDSHLFSYNSNFESNFNEFSFKRCLSSYLINSLGAFAINMQDYWYPEICCGGLSSCLNFGDTSKYFTSEPHPCDSDSSFSGAECNVGNLPCNIYNLFGIKWAKAGKWKSDTDTEKNNIAMLDTPAHASLNLFSTGTCVDYSNSLTTLLRKAGFLEDEVLSVIGVGHGYNLVKLPGDINWHFVDTVGNAGGGIQTSPSTGGYSYCTSSYSSILMHGCYNDVKGKSLNNCPDISSEVVGCEGIGPCASFKDYCFFNKNCCDGSQCSFFQCKDCKANEESCFSNGDCCDGSQCDFFKCKDCKANEDSCLSDGDCCSGKCKWNWWFWNKCE
jgi:PKD repeat protein